MKEENKAVIKALNMYGRVPEMWELLEEIERLHSIIKEVREYITYWHYRNDFRINSFTGQIIDIKEADNIPGNPKLYLIKYPLFTFKNPFKRKLWTFGFDLEKVD